MSWAVSASSVASLDRDRALRHRRQHDLGADALADVVGKPKPVEPRASEKRRVGLPVGKLLESRFHIAAQRHDFEVRAAVQNLRLPPQRRRADDGAFRRFAQGRILEADEGVARVFPLQGGADRETARQHRRHILGGMYGEVDGALQQGLLDLLGKEPLAAFLS